MAKCQFCGKDYTPAQGIAKAFDYCHACSSERQQRANKFFYPYGFDLVDIGGGYAMAVPRKKPIEESIIEYVKPEEQKPWKNDVVESGLHDFPASPEVSVSHLNYHPWEKKDHFDQDGNPISVNFEAHSTIGTMYEAMVKWDGCVEFTERETDGSYSNMHICSLDSHIALLTELRDKAKAHFGEDWES